LVTKHRDVVAGLDELPRFKDGHFIETSEGGEKVANFSWISSQTGDRLTRRTADLPINLICDQLQKRRNIPATKIFVSLFCDIERCAHGLFGCWGATEQKSGIGKCSESNNLSFNYLQASITYTD
jgi:hypothetical protein